MYICMIVILNPSGQRDEFWLLILRSLTPLCVVLLKKKKISSVDYYHYIYAYDTFPEQKKNSPFPLLSAGYHKTTLQKLEAVGLF